MAEIVCEGNERQLCVEISVAYVTKQCANFDLYYEFHLEFLTSSANIASGLVG
ncbi:hypothetical protein DPMN_090353 [Dreissena polymorpha]|uniref:Uncharacterized protein n=1 Tax=Dreissena polymorpha TaxID=45954 RepID=A0A9D4KXZ5_DREPO|nr:hypothetical protein DPMN_090353 [Dreissena polymorpha]